MADNRAARKQKGQDSICTYHLIKRLNIFFCRRLAVVVFGVFFAAEARQEDI